ncbi:MAG: bifunctional 5,10-methylenetetrahydrofolate dehydrogenase/5,10-methenyltetrahydrofolate cyclohydrolase, partial [Eubacteriales bacterium]|nr:bifunctional 5,10-methylenetetrahydrofolate dehydrogenase/5,10-methenyltetrahydrofolate cyclohydrolase [Eubacteriales bacterium]
MLLKGKPVADKIKETIINEVEYYKNNGSIVPRIAILRMGQRPDDISYESRVLKNCDAVGIEAEVIEENNSKTKNIIEILEKLNQNPKIHGILIFRPLPKQLDMEQISRAILPEKDIDCMNPINIEKVFVGDKNGIAPCTPEAVIEILKHYKYDLNGKNVTIVNRSMVLGKPLSMLFLDENATVTICHSKTKDLSGITSKADIIVTGVGKGKFFGPEFFSKESIVIDVGINFVNDSICGDVDFKAVSDKVGAITPVPGGVGTVTSMILLNHVIKAMKLQE